MDLLLELVSSELRYMPFHSFSVVSIFGAWVTCTVVTPSCNRQVLHMSFKNSLGEDYSKVGKGDFSSLQQRSLKSLQLTDPLQLL